MAAVPEIDLRDYRSGDAERRGRFVSILGAGLQRFGFVTLAGHGIEQGLIRRVYRLFEQFFAQSPDVKERYSGVAGGQRGFTSFAREHAKDCDAPDLKEFFHIGQELVPSHPLHAVYPQNCWPAALPELPSACLALFSELEACASTILEALGLYFELPSHTFSALMRDGNSILRALHYPPVPADAPPGAQRAAPHEDINLITLLCEASGQGLEILTRDGSWLAVEAPQGRIVVDAGDMLSRVTNDMIPSTTHRVVNPTSLWEGEGQGGHRYSLPFFAHPYPDCDLSVMQRFTSQDRPARYPAITAEAFLAERLREIGLA